MTEPFSYKNAGVDIDEGSKFVSKIKKILSNRKKLPGLLGGIGSFGGLFDLGHLGLQHPVLVTSIDGVGTKLTVARMMQKHDTVGEDLVNHSINDILVQGAKPLYFTDYIGCGKLDANVMEMVIQGMARACEASGCILIGGETAEMPGMYQKGDYDLVGAITGIVEKEKLITGARITAHNRIIGLPSTGLHTNGYSLARKIIFDHKNFKPDAKVPELTESIGETLLIPHRSYAPLAYDLMNQFDILGFAHITGGGITENLPRILPNGIGARINPSTIHVLPIFECIRKWGNVSLDEMYRVFNMGIGLTIIVSMEQAEECLKVCQSVYPESSVIGETIESDSGVVTYQ